MDLSRIMKVDVRIIYLLLILAVCLPMLFPLGIPLSISSYTKEYFAKMDAIPAGEKVLLSLDYSPGGGADVHPQAVAITEHLLNKGVKVVMISFWDAGPMFGEQILSPYDDSEDGYEYGIDYVNLGYLPGGETAIKRFGEDITGAVSKDFRGNALGSLPIMEGIKDARDFSAVVCFSTGTPGIQEWVRQVQGPLGINFFASPVTVNAPVILPFVTSGQAAGILIGLRGAAEYELLMESPGQSVAKMDAQSLGHIVILAFILLGNLAYFLDRKAGKA